ncbi:MAG: AP endonuclease [Thermoplasmata archaeon]|nr:MAG: AP endonuclease [Thermoplasmata archaeon]
MIRFGPAGIPLSSKGRTLRDAVEDVNKFGLNALEVQFVRTHIIERYAHEEEIGYSMFEVPGTMIVDVIREEDGEKKILSVRKKIEKGDMVRVLASKLARDYMELREIGEIAKELDVELSVHAPYYIVLSESKDRELVRRSIDGIRWAGLVGHVLDARVVVTHGGLYGKRGKEKGVQNIIKNLREIKSWFRRNRLSPMLGIETSGKQELFGTLDEVLDLSKKLNLFPVLNFAHIHAREGGSLRTAEDFEKLFERVNSVRKMDWYHTHFSGVEHEGGNEIRLTPLKKGDLKFESLASYLASHNPQITIICSSPLLEHDAIYMKVMYERAVAHLIAKRKKHEKKSK